MATKRASPAPTVSADEARWRARSDADTLAQAQEIMADRKRLSAAQRSAKEQATRLDRVVNCAPKGRAPVKRK
ncbi:hypothetical protein BM43_473 [Burkholderia gladioli]|uniref:Uncharacterized protein n=1 Tax=Burkholderia gladioli TaxID=28095 RepID=A0A095FGZ8_BURGA|nr:hypothetical protein [Burkholderia gladioli]AJW97432.1 hypothetical protein BM43_473 [Burkholderia gladioli]ASD80407.1 hypothetical protein CEJ98_16440 [Burkholderia gladioli pv. gladioli]AWY54353.1 hypothetical protein A8H28_24685 [Burkholderia gladioli pv. gladioli]KGC16275.1 hypothetical protein DM48_5171 [Burkholderia gladioli]PEH37409.1 hypothetical protein CRM94_22985 [Burkholderia gladioli]